MENSESNTDNVPSDEEPFSLKKGSTIPAEGYNSDYWLREFIKIRQCPQRFDALESQLEDLFIIGEKFGLYHAAHFIKNYYHFKCKP